MKPVFIKVLSIFVFLFFSILNLYAQEITNDPVENGTIENEVSETKGDEEEKEKDTPSKKVNVDVLALYGLYNYLLSATNISYNDENFVSFLSTDLKRSNDFGYGDSSFKDDKIYANSSYYENAIELTINYNYSDTLKLIFDGGTNNDSRGMFDNDLYLLIGKTQIYNREEKDKVKGNCKVIKKVLSQSLEWYIGIGGAQYVHRLIKVASEDPDKYKVNQINPEFGGEWVLAASNRIRFKVGHLYYDYLQEGKENDWHFQCESIYDMKLPWNILFSLGINYNINRDRKSPYASDKPKDLVKNIFKDNFIVGVSYKGIKNLTTEFLYRFDVVPFQPEEFYLEQKFIQPASTNDLPPGEVRHTDLIADYKANDIVKIKAIFLYEKNSNFYNYFPVQGNVLSAETIPVVFYKTGLDTQFNIYKKIVEFTLSYMYSYYEADENITYHSSHELSNMIKLNTDNFGIEWGHKLVGDVYTDPEDDEKIPESVIGHIGLQLQVMDGFYSYLKVDNLYNNRYVLREGYPEPGVTLLGGLRILI